MAKKSQISKRKNVFKSPATKARQQAALAKNKWKKGQSGNPLGGKLHDPVIKAVKKLTREELAKVGKLVIEQDVKTLRKGLKDGKSNALFAMVAALVVRTADRGDPIAFEKLLDRLAGKAKDEIELGGPEGKPIRTSAVSSLIADPDAFAALALLEKKLKEGKKDGS